MSEIIKADIKNKTVLTEDGKIYPLTLNNELEEIFKIQKDFQKKLYDPDKLEDKKKVDLSKEYILSSIRELSEVLNEMPWKTHRKYVSYSVKKDKLLEEIVDSIKFILNLCVIWEINSEEFLEAFKLKSLKVQKRYEEEIENSL